MYIRNVESNDFFIHGKNALNISVYLLVNKRKKEINLDSRHEKYKKKTKTAEIHIIHKTNSNQDCFVLNANKTSRIRNV